MALTSRLEEYNPKWQSLFEAEKICLISIFGLELDAIHHVGSTAIEGMLAKPEIDILVVMKDEAILVNLFSKIESLGYRARGEEPGVPGHWYFCKDQNGKRTHKLHLCGATHPCVQDQLLFRDFLRKDPQRALAYRHLKAFLEETNTKGMSEYLAKKAPFIEETLKLAIKMQL